MSRLDKKCFIASISMHLLLLLVFFVSPAFMPEKKEIELPVITLIPQTLTDAPFFGGGPPVVTPSPTPAPPAVQPQPNPPAPAVVQPKPEPIQPEPEPPKTVPPPEPKLEAPVKIPKPKPVEHKSPDADFPKPKPSIDPKAPKSDIAEPDEKPRRKKPDIELSFKKNSEATMADRAAQARAERSRQLEARNQYLRTVNKLANRMQQGLSAGTEISMPEGPGGEFFANYLQVVRSKYRNAWIAPNELKDESATATIQVVIAREGNVISRELISRSGDATLDKSVERVLQAVTFIAPFPKEAKDSKRVFVIDFSLKSKI